MTMAVVEGSPPAPQPQPEPQQAPEPVSEPEQQVSEPAPEPAPAAAPKQERAAVAPSGAFPKDVRAMTIVTRTTNYKTI